MRMLLAAGFCLLLAAFTALGFWQLDRAAQKRVLFDAFEAGETSVAGTSLIGAAAAAGQRYRRLELSGRYLSSRQILLDSMTHAGRAGYQVLTPFRPDGGDTWVVVNRGWIAGAPLASAPPAVDVGELRRTITGRIDALPRPGLKLDAAGKAADPSWPRVLLYPSLAEVEAELELPLAGYQLLLDADQADGFVRAWQPRSMPPERHVGYAVQWFGLALALVAIAAILSVRALRNRRPNAGR